MNFYLDTSFQSISTFIEQVKNGLPVNRGLPNSRFVLGFEGCRSWGHWSNRHGVIWSVHTVGVNFFSDSDSPLNSPPNSVQYLIQSFMDKRKYLVTEWECIGRYFRTFFFPKSVGFENSGQLSSHLFMYISLQFLKWWNPFGTLRFKSLSLWYLIRNLKVLFTIGCRRTVARTPSFVILLSVLFGDAKRDIENRSRFWQDRVESFAFTHGRFESQFCFARQCQPLQWTFAMSRFAQNV